MNRHASLVYPWEPKRTSALRRFSTGVIAQIVAGHKISTDDDPYMQSTQALRESLGRAGIPGVTALDLFPSLILTSGIIAHSFSSNAVDIVQLANIDTMAIDRLWSARCWPEQILRQTVRGQHGNRLKCHIPPPEPIHRGEMQFSSPAWLREKPLRDVEYVLSSRDIAL
ncbi:hypothetical protein B0H19DRAFT_1277363 [Mycena capillaripes]|nr:hypothetical protein B0H19DRAFT_1277363 [Mycena capillaripes]